MQHYRADQFVFWGRCKRAAMLFDWVEGLPVEAIEKHYSTTPFQGSIGYGNLMTIAEATRFHLRSAHQIISTLVPDRPEFLMGLDDLLTRLEFGLPKDLLELTQVRPRLSRGQCLALARAGATTLAALEALDADILRTCVGAATALQMRPRK